MANAVRGGPTGYPNFKFLRDYTRSMLSDSLDAIEGQKDIVIQPELMQIMDKIFGAILLKEHGICKLFKMDENLTPSIYNQRVFVIKADVKKATQVANLINSDIMAHGKKCSYKILMIPRKLHVCEKVFEEEGVFEFITIESLNIGLIPLDYDLLSLEMPTFFRTFFLDRDLIDIYSAAMSLVDIQAVLGSIPNVYGQGKAAEMTYELTSRLLDGKNLQTSSEIGSMFLFDRDVDYATVLLTQLTYEGLLDETFGISCGYINFDSEVTGSNVNLRMSLSSNDEIFQEIRNRHFSKVFKFLSAKTKELQNSSQQRKQMSLGQMKEFVSNELKDVQQQHRSLTLFIGACEVIMKKKSRDFEEHLRTEHSLMESIEFLECVNYIEETINRQYDISLSLRLLCLLSYTNDGLSSKDYKSLKTQFLQSYGHEHLITFHYLQKLGLFVEQEGANKFTGKVVAAMPSLPRKRSFQAITKKLNLIPKCDSNYNLENPSDMGYVFSGAYIPIICNLVKQILKKEGFTGLEDTIKHLPGPSFIQNHVKSARGNGTSSPSHRPASKVVLVYFLGGVTYAEIAALRLLGEQQGYKFVVAATSIINGNTLLENVLEDVKKLREGMPT